MKDLCVCAGAAGEGVENEGWDSWFHHLTNATPLHLLIRTPILLHSSGLTLLASHSNFNYLFIGLK